MSANLQQVLPASVFARVSDFLRLNSSSASVYSSHAGDVEDNGEGVKEVFYRYGKRYHCGSIERQHDVRRNMPLE
jgi:hypothetical protein